MLHIKRSSNIAFYNSNIKNGKWYVMYVQQVNGFTFDSSRFTNSWVLGMYIGHADQASSNIKITNSYFWSNSTNAIALLWVTGRNINSNIISGNTFERNHYIGQWAVAPQYGSWLTWGGQVYFARASNVTFKNNIIKNGSCAGCRWWIHGLELSEPNKPSLSNILIENNTFTNNSSYGIYKNSWATLRNVTIRWNSIDKKGTNISWAN
jgi:polygalacturonase